MLEVRLIGKFEIQRDGKPVMIASRAGQSLFAYLVLSAGNQHRREKLAGMFWPDVSEKKARAYLRYELWRIRKALSAASKFDYLLTDDINISFNSSADYWLDVAQLKKADEGASVEELINALSVFHGELLPGFYEDWITEEREHLQVLYEQRTTRLLELLEKEQRWQNLLEWGERWITLGSTSETAYRALMTAYDALGDRAKVTATYERCLQALRELDLEPSEQTRALAFKKKSSLNIPLPLTSFIGRENELKEVAALLSKSRLVTLTGSGGVGKTRLAIQAVAEVIDSFPDGVWFLDLAPVNEPASVAITLADVLDLSHTTAHLSMTELIVGYLGNRKALIIFDNCEHVIESAVQLVNALLVSCQGLHILATSREVLRVAGEITYRVPSLGVPLHQRTVTDLAKIESVQLFVERAKALSPSFELLESNASLIAEICRRLSGIPLAVELAAARVDMLSVRQIAEQLDNCFRLLTKGVRTAPPRQQTLRAVIDWSYNLLSEDEQLLLCQLSVFVDGWTLEASESVGGWEDTFDLLTRLVDKSLVVVDREREQARYYFLETIRQYAREKLVERGEENTLRARHLNYCLALAQKAEPELYGYRQIEWLQKLEDERENMRAALQWSLQNDMARGQHLAGALWWWWVMKGDLSEGHQWLEKMLATTSKDETLIRAKLLSALGELSAQLGYDEVAKKHSEESIALFRRLGDEVGPAFPLSTLGGISDLASDYERNTHLLHSSLDIYRQVGNQWGVSHVLRIVGYNASIQGDLELARKSHEESLRVCRVIGDKAGMAFSLFLLAGLFAADGDEAGAMDTYEEALKIERVIKITNVSADILTELGHLVSYKGNYQRGKQLLEESLEVNRKMGFQVGIARSLRYLGWNARLQGDYHHARSLYAQSLQLSHQIQNNTAIAASLMHIGSLFLVQGSPQKFVQILGCVEKAVPESRNTLLPYFQDEVTKFMEDARASLGDEAYRAAWEAGQQQRLEEVVVSLLKELQ